MFWRPDLVLAGEAMHEPGHALLVCAVRVSLAAERLILRRWDARDPHDRREQEALREQREPAAALPEREAVDRVAEPAAPLEEVDTVSVHLRNLIGVWQSPQPSQARSSLDVNRAALDGR